MVDIGSGVTSVKKGDHVVLTVRRGCPENCISCANGQPDFCFTGHFTERGIKQRHGYMTEFVVDDEKYMNIVPAALKDFAVLLEPLTIAEKSLMQIYHIQSRLHWECRLQPNGKPQDLPHGDRSSASSPVEAPRSDGACVRSTWIVRMWWRGQERSRTERTRY